MTVEKIFQFSKTVGRLKTVKRSGWISQAGIKEPESVADHSFRCAVLAMCLGDILEVNVEKLVKMMLLHDIQEALTGDYDHKAKRRIGASEVKRRERIAVKKVLSLLPLKLEKQYLSLWEELEEGGSAEAVLANDVDKIEVVMQALDYEAAGYSPDRLEAFWVGTRDKIGAPITQELLSLLKKKHEALKKKKTRQRPPSLPGHEQPPSPPP